MTDDFLKGIVVGVLIIWIPILIISAFIDKGFTPDQKLFLYEVCKEK